MLSDDFRGQLISQPRASTWDKFMLGKKSQQCHSIYRFDFLITPSSRSITTKNTNCLLDWRIELSWVYTVPFEYKIIETWMYSYFTLVLSLQLLFNGRCILLWVQEQLPYYEFLKVNYFIGMWLSQPPIIAWSKWTIKTLEQGMNYVQS